MPESQIKVLVLSYTHRGETFFVAPGLGIEVSDVDRKKAFNGLLEHIALSADDALERNLDPLFADHALERGDFIVPKQAEAVTQEVITLIIE